MYRMWNEGKGNVLLLPKMLKISWVGRNDNTRIDKTVWEENAGYHKKVNDARHVNIAWNATVDKYIWVMENMKVLLSMSEFRDDTEHRLQRRMDRYI